MKELDPVGGRRAGGAPHWIRQCMITESIQNSWKRMLREDAELGQPNPYWYNDIMVTQKNFTFDGRWAN